MRYAGKCLFVGTFHNPMSNVKTMMGNLRELYPLFVFSNSSSRQRKFDAIMKAGTPGTKKTKLVDLCKTRWVERHVALETYTELFLVAHGCLGQIYEDGGGWEWDVDLTTKASGLHALGASGFIVAFVRVRNSLRFLR